MVTFRDIKLNEIHRIVEIDASCYIEHAWRTLNGKRQMIRLDYQELGFPEGVINHINALEETIRNNGFSVGAFNDEGKMIGFLTLNSDIFGNINKYVLLDQLFISRPYRNSGIGKGLFHLSIEQARRMGASNIYICAGSSADTIAFYRKLGCQDATEINQELYDSDPRDIHLEFKL